MRVFGFVAFYLLLAGCSGGGSEPEVPAQFNPAPAVRKAFAERLISIHGPIQAYRLESGHVPEGTGAGVLHGAGITNAPPEDPWGNAVQYEGAGEHYEFRSAGPDRQWETADDIRIRDGQLLP